MKERDKFATAQQVEELRSELKTLSELVKRIAITLGVSVDGRRSDREIEMMVEEAFEKGRIRGKKRAETLSAQIETGDSETAEKAAEKLKRLQMQWPLLKNDKRDLEVRMVVDAAIEKTKIREQKKAKKLRTQIKTGDPETAIKAAEKLKHIEELLQRLDR